MEGIVSSEFLFQLIQARITNKALQARASEIEPKPMGRETIRAAGLKTKAPISKATVIVYWVPVGFC
jgi:hypothetical protein